MNKPNQQTVREIVRDHIRSGHADIGTTIVKHFGNGALGDEEYSDWYHAVVQAWRIELRAVSWPDEQQPADVVTAEQQQDGAVGRDEAAEQAEERYRNTRTHVLVALSEHCSFPHIGLAATAVTALVKPQLEAVYAAGLRTEAERTALAARVAELESERKADVRAVMRCQRAKAGPDAVPAMLALDARFADRIAVLDADTDGGAA